MSDDEFEWCRIQIGGSEFTDEENERFDRLIALARTGAAVKKAPDPLDEALNSGDGVYRP